MKTTVVIDDKLLRDAMEAAGAKTKREAIEVALRELVRRKRIAELRKMLGTHQIDLTQDELDRMRSDE